MLKLTQTLLSEGIIIAAAGAGPCRDGQNQSLFTARVRSVGSICRHSAYSRNVDLPHQPTSIAKQRRARSKSAPERSTELK